VAIIVPRIPRLSTEGEGATEFDYLSWMPVFQPRVAWFSRPRLGRRAQSVALGAVVALAGTGGQSERLDVGSFTISVRGQRAGREQFSLQRVVGPDGEAFELRAESAIGDRRSAMRLETDSAGTPVRYSVEERTGATLSLRLGGQRVRGRFQTLSRSTTGEAAREYLLVPGALVLEDEGLLQYALVVRRPLPRLLDTLSVPALTPIANRQGTVRLVLESAADTIDLAGARRASRRWKVLTASGEVRLIWADADGRLLRIQIPGRALDAVRDDVPR
jgi:hypothetical protein